MSSTTQESMVDQAKSGIGDAASAVQEKAGELKEQGRGKLGQTLDRRTNDAGGQARQAASAMRQTSAQMRQGESGSEQLASLVEAAAERVERLGGYLQRTSGDRMLGDVEDFARRRPWMVAGVGLAAGLAASRFLKASSERRYDAGPRGAGSGYAYSARRMPGQSYQSGTTYESPRYPYDREPSQAAASGRSYGDGGVA